LKHQTTNADETGGAGLAGSAYTPGFSVRFLRPRYWPTWLGIGLVALGAVLPAVLSRGLGDALGSLFMRTNAKRRRIARINLGLCFPELDAGARERLLHEHFRAAGRALMGLGLVWFGSTRRIDRQVRVVGGEELRERLATGQPTVVLTGHVAGADVGGIVLSRMGPGIVMMKRQRNELFNWFVARGRARFGARTILREQGLRAMVRGMREGRGCYYVPDEDFGPENSVFAPFFGVPTATLPVLGRLARLTGARVFPCFTRALPDGRWEVILDPPLEDFPTGDDAADARRMNEALEHGIRRDPAQYMWTLRWFRTRPDDSPSPYKTTAP